MVKSDARETLHFVTPSQAFFNCAALLYLFSYIPRKEKILRNDQGNMALGGEWHTYASADT